MRQLMLKAGEQGLLMVEIPEAYGVIGVEDHHGIDRWRRVFPRGKLQRHCRRTHGDWYPSRGLLRTHEAKSEILPKSATGEWIGAYCLTEPGSGSTPWRLEPAP